MLSISEMLCFQFLKYELLSMSYNTIIHLRGPQSSWRNWLSTRLACVRAWVQVQVREKYILAFFGVLKDGDLEYDNRFMAAHIALRVKVFFG